MRQSIAGIVYQNGVFLIGHRLPTGEMGGRWEFPGGKVDPGETPEESLHREFREELNLPVRVERLLTRAFFENKNGPVELLAYQVTLLGTEPVSLTEHTEIRWATLDEIERLDFVDSDRLLLPFIKQWVHNA